MEEFTDRLHQQQTMAFYHERVIVNQTKVDGKKNEKHNLSNHYHELREEKKRSIATESYIADALKVKDDLVSPRTLISAKM